MQIDAPDCADRAASPTMRIYARFHLGAPWAAPVARKRHRPPTVRRECLLAQLGDGDGGPLKSTYREAISFPLLYSYPRIMSGLPTSAIPIVERVSERI